MDHKSTPMEDGWGTLCRCRASKTKLMSLGRTISACVLLWTMVACGTGAEAVSVEHGSRFDRESGQLAVDTERGVDEVLRKLRRVRYRDLPQPYVERTEQNMAPFKKRLARRRYLEVRGTQRLMFIAGRFRIDDFLAHDEVWRRHNATYDQSEPQFLLLDPKLPRTIVRLQNALRRRELDAEAFDVREAFRPPRLNREDGGASRSRHIYGEAVDLVIGDINRDGTADAADKAIVLDLLEHKLVRNRGGIGRYPGSQTIHFDFRGRRARWDSY